MKSRLLLSLLLLQGAFAQEQPGFVRFLAVGENPTMVLKNIGGRRVQQPPVPGSIPPKSISVSGALKPGVGVPLALNKFSAWIKVVDRALPLQVFEGADEGATKWAEVTAPTVPKLSVFMKDRAQQKISWNKTNRFDFAETLAAFPNESIRVINLTNANVAVKLGEKNGVVVKAKEAKIFKANDGAKVGDTFAKIGVKANGNWGTIHQAPIDLFRNQRVTMVLYLGDRPPTMNKVYMKILTEPTFVPVAR